MTIEEASAKVREGPVHDDEADYSLPHWAGIVPAQHGWKNPVPDSRLSPNVELPRYLRNLTRRKNSVTSVPETPGEGELIPSG